MIKEVAGMPFLERGEKNSSTGYGKKEKESRKKVTKGTSIP